MITPQHPATKIQGKLPNLDLADFVRRFISPYITSLKIVEEPAFRSEITKPTWANIEEVIKAKVEELKNYSLLQDEEYGLEESDDKLTLEGEDETTIMEILPAPSRRLKESLRHITNASNSFKDDIQKYKKMRNRIKKALKREEISVKTRRLVTTTLDDMIAQIVSHQCTWKDNATRTSMKNDMNTDPNQLAKSWSTVWKQLKTEYYKTANGESTNDAFFNKFQKLVTTMIKDMHLVSQYYKTVCSVVNVNSTTDNKTSRYTTVSRNEDKVPAENTEVILRNADECVHFKICSKELKGLMLDFYNNLNDTAVSTLRNYAAMFLRDVTQESDKDLVIAQINKTADAIEAKVNKTFQKQIHALTLDKNKNPKANENILKDFVNITIDHVNTAVRKIIKKNMKVLNAKLQDTVTDDIHVNLDMDLGNLKRELTGRICTIFEICNSNYMLAKRRSGTGGGNEKKLFVKVQLTLDHGMKHMLAKRLQRGSKKTQEIPSKTPEFSAIPNVTRTTLSAVVNVTRTRIISKHPHIKH